MPNAVGEERPTRGHKKRARTREQLIAAGVQALADRGEALTVSDVVARAEVSNGTFYNYFTDRDDLIDALGEHSLFSLVAQFAQQTAEEHPARRFAFATSLVLARAAEDPTWARAVLRLADHERSFQHELHRFLREDLAAGFEQGCFTFGADDISLDAITGLLMMSIRRIVRGEAAPDQAGHGEHGDYIERVLGRALMTLGVGKREASKLAAEAAAAAAGTAATPE